MAPLPAQQAGRDRAGLRRLRRHCSPSPAPFIAGSKSTPIPFGPNDVDVANRLHPPDAQHHFGTDELGRDVLARMIHGARVSLTVGLLATMMALVVGCFLGAIAGYYGGVADWLVSRLIEVVLCFPLLFLVAGDRRVLRPVDLDDHDRPRPDDVDQRGALHPRRVPAHPRDGVRLRGAGQRRARLAHHLPPPPAERARAGAGLGEFRRRLRHPHRVRPLLPRPRRPASDRDLGQHPRLGQAVHRVRLVAGRLPRRGDFPDRGRLQHHRRPIPRRARSADRISRQLPAAALSTTRARSAERAAPRRRRGGRLL